VTTFTPILISAHNPGPMTGAGNNTYLLIGGAHDSVLVDAGVGDPRHLAAIDRVLSARYASLGRVLVTHGHRDHVSGASAIAAKHPRAAFAKCPWPGQDQFHAVRWETLADQQEIVVGSSSLVALHTPGHSPDHVAFWHEPSRAAFTGDLVIEGSSVMIDSSRGGDLAQYLASLERLMRLRPATLFPGHGPIIRDPMTVLAGYIEHRLNRERQIVEAVQAGRVTVPAIVESIYHDLDPRLIMPAHENVRAHLEKLKAEGRAFWNGEQWTVEAS
jgi:ribonuclease/clavin/mitogillin